MKIQRISDNTAIGLSMLCIAHCLLIPILIVLVPSISSVLSANNEVFHQQLLYGVVAFSLVALSIGIFNHKKISIFLLGCFGLFILVSAVITKIQFFGSFTEIVLTVAGSCIVAFTHVKNYRFRHQQCNQIAN
ncbi:MULTISPECIES: MerC domain-containing protein [unclassified Pseudoalteromonas]|uniref:MerC domain-containing protein n=1 Tax=unclassified Pseudoalteromonas TaxID=194690 RepID=UPI0009E23ABC|nr:MULTISPECIES: MerC domain-containing protein [unclassified Pseudoalteromonas]